MQKPFKWDNFSDQPYQIKDQTYKKNMRKKWLWFYLWQIILFLLISPIALIMQLFIKKNTKTKIGIGVNLDKGEAQYSLVEELGVKNLLVRIPLWDIKNIDNYVDFIKGFGDDKYIVVNIMQDREHIDNKELLTKNIITIFNKLESVTTTYQIGNAINRAKWGFFSTKEYLDFYQIVQNIRDKNFKNLKLIGPSVIDFEYQYTIYALFNLKNIKFNALSSLLYVDRRGDPDNRQHLFFNLKQKINFLYSLVKLSTKTKNKIYITETNWPLKNTYPYAPTSDFECVNIKDYDKYMREYFKTCILSGKIDYVFWHQLIAPGYGLVDNRDNKIIKNQAFYSFKKLIKDNG